MKYWRKPLDIAKYKTTKGEIHIIEDRCKGCNFCIEFCPNEVLVESSKFNIKGYHPPEPNDEDKCIGCKLCEYICPDFAIYVIVHEDEKAEIDEIKTDNKSAEVASDA
ncbi:MAG: 4Fe-4S binding protein [Thermoplasmata archaeon]|nr:4Fe-4S binding protein [Thermoplasmata archaeon]